MPWLSKSSRGRGRPRHTSGPTYTWDLPTASDSPPVSRPSLRIRDSGGYTRTSLSGFRLNAARDRTTLLATLARAVKKFVDAVCGSALQTLHDFKQRERPAGFTLQCCQQEVDVIGHHHRGEQIDSFPVLSENMFQNKVACFIGQDERTACTEGYEQRRVDSGSGAGGGDIGTWEFLEFGQA